LLAPKIRWSPSQSQPERRRPSLAAAGVRVNSAPSVRSHDREAAGIQQPTRVRVFRWLRRVTAEQNGTSWSPRVHGGKAEGTRAAIRLRLQECGSLGPIAADG